MQKQQHFQGKKQSLGCRSLKEDGLVGGWLKRGQKFSTEQMLIRELSRKTKATLGCQSPTQTEV